MPATSVTGRGLGDSHGKYKPLNNQRTAYTEQPVIKNSVIKCMKNISVCGNSRHIVSSNAKIIKSCGI